MKRRLIYITILFSLLIIGVTAILYFRERKAMSESTIADHIVDVNEIEQLAKNSELKKLESKTTELKEKLRGSRADDGGNLGLWLMCGICVLFLVLVIAYIYFAILKPFDRLKEWSGEIARGNFDIPLDYERANWFGEFTWAFDSMRREITKARACEKEAIENNKTVIATLSHDIKTPIASIRAYAEGLEANMDSTAEKRERYLGVIMKKCDEVSKLTNDLFLHSLSDLDKLKITAQNIEITGFMDEVIAELAGEHDDIIFKSPDFKAYVSADINRLTQITENLINNSRKYAKTQIEVELAKKDGYVSIHFRDYGPGIPDEDMPFIFHKFYRGNNCGNEQGSGLGLYIVKYLTEQMKGEVILQNHSNGMEAIVRLPEV